jgi:3,4-dihydroxy 2-butanone 4-phosphate synthase/GTP cyclohydrolase II
MMSAHNQSPYHTAFTVSIEAREGVTTGISAHDRAHTIRVAVNPETTSADLVTPGHIFPLRARDGGVLVRTGQTEGSVDLSRLAGLRPAGVICEIMNDDGTMARLPDLKIFAAKHRLRIVSVADLIRWRVRAEVLVERVLEAEIPLVGLGDFRCHVYRSLTGSGVHLALTLGDVIGNEPILTRMQSYTPMSDIFGAIGEDDSLQLETALQLIKQQGAGVLVYMNIAGQNTDAMLNRLRTELRIEPKEPVPTQSPDQGALRKMGLGAQILRELGVRKMRLMTNNPRKIVGLDAYGLEVTDLVPLKVLSPDSENLSRRGSLRQQLAQALTETPTH